MTQIKFHPKTKREAQTNADDIWWTVVGEKGSRLCVKAPHDIRWIDKNQVKETQ